MCGYALSDRPPFLRLAGSRTDDRRPHTGQYRLGADFRSGKSEFCAPLRAAAEGPTIIAIYNGSNPLRAQRGALCDRARYLGASFFRPRQSLPVLFGGECPPPQAPSSSYPGSRKSRKKSVSHGGKQSVRNAGIPRTVGGTITQAVNCRVLCFSPVYG